MSHFGEHRLIYIFSEAMAGGAMAMGAAAEGAMETGAEVAAESTEAVAETAAETPEAAQEFAQSQAGEMMSQADNGAAQFSENIGDSQAFAESVHAESSMMDQAGSSVGSTEMGGGMLESVQSTTTTGIDTGSDMVKGGIDSVGSAVKGPVGDVAGSIGRQQAEGAVPEILGGTIRESAGNLGEAAGRATAEGAVDSTTEAMKSGVEGVATSAKDVVGNIGDTVKDMKLPDGGAESPLGDALQKVEGLLDKQATAPMDEQLPTSVDPQGEAMQSIPKALENMSGLAEKLATPGGMQAGRSTPGILPEAPTDFLSQLPQPMQDLWKGIQDVWKQFTGIFDGGNIGNGTPPIVPENGPVAPGEGLPADPASPSPSEELPGADKTEPASTEPEDSVPDSDDVSSPSPEPAPEPEAPKPTPEPAKTAPKESAAKPEPAKRPAEKPAKPAPAPKETKAPAAPKKQPGDDLSGWQRWKMRRAHEWIDEESKAELDKAIKAQDALAGDDQAMNELADEYLKNDGTLTENIGVDIGRVIRPKQTDAMLRQKIQEQYNAKMEAVERKKGLSRGEIDYLIHLRRTSSK